MIEAIGTYLPPWVKAAARVSGDDEDIVTLAVAAGLEALDAVASPRITSVRLVSRDLPLLVNLTVLVTVVTILANSASDLAITAWPGQQQ